MAFIQQLDKEGMEFFQEISTKTFSQQAITFLDVYWNEIGSQADFIFSVGYEIIKYADMHFKGVTLIHLYDEGNSLDFNAALYFYEKLCHLVLDSPEGQKWLSNPNYKISIPEMLTAIVRKKELKEKVDVDFDGKVSFLEYLLYQYRDFCNPKEFVTRALTALKMDECEEVKLALIALEEVNAAIRAYENEKNHLKKESELPGVKGLTAQNMLMQLLSGVLAEKLNNALINAEAAVRIATKKSGKGYMSSDGKQSRPVQGSTFWMNRELEERKRLYGKK